MKTKVRSIKTEGQVLLVCVGIAAVLGVSLAAIFSYTSNQFTAVARSQAWNESLVIAEAGVEDAMQLMNKYSNTGTPILNWNTTASADNWSSPAANVYYVRRYIGSNYYDAYITNSNPLQPIIRVTGNKPWRRSYGGDNVVDRTLIIATGTGSLYSGPPTAKYGVTIGGNIVIDSYNSQIPAYNTGGRYDATKRKDGGGVATVASNVSAVAVGGNVKIYGKIYTGPGDTISLNGGASAGSLSWVNGGSAGLQSGWSQSDLNIAIPDAPSPAMSSPGILPSKIPNTYQGTTYNNSYMLTGGDYKHTVALSLTSTDTILVSGNVKLWFTGNFSMAGQSKIIIGTNSSLTIYSGGSVSLNGGGAINQSGFATNFVIYGQPTSTNISYAGGSDFTGIIYAPYADFSMTGGGNTIYNYSGTAVVKTINMNGKYQFHYDESLANTSAGPGFYVTSWKEQ